IWRSGICSKSARVNRTPRSRSAAGGRGRPQRTELGGRAPARPRILPQHALRDRVQRLEVLERAGEVPARVELVVGLVVELGRVLLAQRLAEPGRLADEVDARIDVERRHALAREAQL